MIEETYVANQADKDTVATEAKYQYVWDVTYIDSPILRDENADDDDDCTDEGSERLYYTWDANRNVTALVSDAGAVVERYVYDPYGRVTIWEDDWSDTVTWANSKANEILFAGYRYDPETGLYHVRHRPYHPTLGRWPVRDPIGYADGMSLYEYVMSNSVAYRDPTGLACCDQCKWGAKKDIAADDVQLKSAPSKYSPKAVAALKEAIVNAQALQKFSAAANLAVSGAQGATAFAVGATDVMTGEGMGGGNMVDAITKGIQAIEVGLMKDGAVIWVHVTWKNCEWTRCWYKPWTGATDYVKKDKWHRCSAESPNAPKFNAIGKEKKGSKLSSGFAIEDTAGIQKAIPKCIKEAIDSVRQ